MYMYVVEDKGEETIAKVLPQEARYQPQLQV